MLSNHRECYVLMWESWLPLDQAVQVKALAKALYYDIDLSTVPQSIQVYVIEHQQI